MSKLNYLSAKDSISKSEQRFGFMPRLDVPFLERIFDEVQKLKEQNSKKDQIIVEQNDRIDELQKQQNLNFSEQKNRISVIEKQQNLNFNEQNDKIEELQKQQNLKFNEQKNRIDELQKEIDQLKQLIADNKIKRQEELKKQEELKRQEELKKQEKSVYPIRLHVKICEGHDLLKMDLFGLSDLFVALRLMSQGKKNVQKTQIISNTINPVWNQEFDFIVTDPNDVLIINMYDKDEKMMNELQFPVSTWSVGNPLDRKEINIKLKKKKAGQLIFEVQAFDTEK